FGRLLYAVGSNDTTAFSSGVNVNAVRVASYGLGGLFAAIGGLALTGLVNSANASSSTEYTLVAIAAVVLGGTPLVGGRGGLVGPLLGAFSIYLMQNLLATFAINPAYLQIVYGGILIVAVVLGGAVSRERAGALTVTALRSAYHLSFGVALLLAVVGAGVLGGAAGYICHRFAINPLVVTLAMGTLAIGIVAVLNGGLVNGNSPQWLSDLAEP